MPGSHNPPNIININTNNTIHTNTTTDHVPQTQNTCNYHGPLPFDQQPQIQPLLLSMESINTANSSYIRPGMGYINITFTKPWKHKVHTMGDTGANINAISMDTAYRLYKKYIQSESRSFRVRTGGGYISCQEYVTFTIKQDDVYLDNLKFYIIPDLPFEYLIGRPVLTHLGYDLSKVNPATPMNYHHPRQNLDSLEEEDMPDYPYPVTAHPKSTQPNLNSTLPNVDIAKRDQQLTNYIKDALLHHSNICAQGEFDVGCIPDSEFKIEFKPNVDTTPIRSPEYPHNIKNIAEIERQLRLMIKMELISRSESPWRFPTFIVPKKNGEARIVFDYRKLNAITKRLAYSLPSIKQLMAKFKGKFWISTIDIKSGYWHIPIRKQDRCKTAFIFNGKVYEWNVMPFGPTNAPPHFQKVMDKLFDDLDYVMVYMDDITIISSNAKQHQQHLQEVFRRLGEYRIKIRPDKCKFAQQSVQYLGFIVDGQGITIRPKYKDKINHIPTPKTLNQMRRFVGLVQYLHQFIPNLQQKLAPFHAMTMKDKRYEWNANLNKAFQSIKSEIMDTEMVYHPDPNRPFIVKCDASIDGVGAVLEQYHDGKLRPVSFCSKLFNKTQRNWHVSEQEIYAVVYAVEKWRPYLVGNKFMVRTDHLNLAELFQRAKNFRAGKLYRWAVRLQEYDFDAKYIQGTKNKVADYMSRDAIKSYHSDSPDLKPPKSRPTNICQLYLHHLCSSANHPYYQSPDSLLYTIDASNMDEPDEQDDDTATEIPPLPTHIVPPPKPPYPSSIASSDTSTTNTIPNCPITTSPTPPPIPHPALQVPQHKYPTRYAQRKRTDASFQTNLQKHLIHIPDTNAHLPLHTPLNDVPAQSQITDTNHHIISNKYSYPAFNTTLLQPTPTSISIQDTYDIESYVKSIPIDTIIHHQITDSFLYPIIQYLKYHNNYYLSDLPDYQYHYLLSGRYYIHRGVLMYRYGTTQAIVIPSILQRSVLKWAHDRVHHGGNKMLLQITQVARYWWIGLRKDIRSYLETCDGCQRLKGRKISTGKIRTFSKTKPFDLVSIDICGPLPQTHNGNRYIVSMIDKFSRFCMLIPVADIKTITIAKAFQNWINLFGIPKALLSDNGTQFTSEIFRCFTEQLQIKQRFTTPYYPECNGQIERLHRWIKERLVVIAIDGGLNFIDGDDNWDDYIGVIQHSYNSTPNTMTKYSPNKIIFGSNLSYNINPVNDNFQYITTNEEYVKYINNIRSIVQNAAISNQTNYDRIRSKTYNKGKKESTEYQVGDLVLIDVSRHTVGNKNKFSPTWHGPHEIIKVISPNKVFEVREIGNVQHIQQTNIKFMKVYKASPYVMVINYINDYPEISSHRIIPYINHRKLNKCLIKLTPSQKRRQL